ncbi:MAG: hypothetical protein U5J64_03130 [Halobacteriales archaeon]|nr:hypothetical protein [Halobacteriales archaeon]
MGENAERAQTYFAERLSESVPDADWETEGRVGRTPVDVVGETDETVALVELEWRRADPADNTAKIFRHASDESGDERDTRVFQVFTRYYQLADGGVSSKRKNAEFVGEVAAESLEGFEYVALTLGFEPPKRGGGMPEGWRGETDAVADEIAEMLRD